jgi:group I intron endonuclease
MGLGKLGDYMIGIYKITSPSGKVYIGQSWDIELRWKNYRNSGRNQKQPALDASINKYGHNIHKFEIIQEFPIDITQEVMDRIEIACIEIYKDAGIKMMNIREGGSRGKHSLESIQRMKGKNGMHMIGRKLSPETIKKRTEKQKGLKRSDESKEKYKSSKVGSKNPAFGKAPWNKGITWSKKKI